MLNTWSQPLDHVWRKLFIQEFADTAVLWWIQKEHPLGKDLIECCKLALHVGWERGCEVVTALARETCAVQASQHVSVTRHDPGTVAKFSYPVYRSGCAQVAVGSVRVSDEIRIEHKLRYFISTSSTDYADGHKQSA